MHQFTKTFVSILLLMIFTTFIGDRIAVAGQVAKNTAKYAFTTTSLPVVPTVQALDAAIAKARHATELTPYVGEEFGQLGWYLILKGDVPAAQVASAKAQALAPDIANWAVNLGHTYLLQGDRNTAHIWYQKSIALIPDANVLKNSILASFDELIKHGWQVEASKAERDWYAQEAKFLVAKSTEANELLKQAERAIQQRDKERVLKEALEGEAHNKAHAREWAFYAEAESAYKRALAIREQFFGIDHPSVAIICAALVDLMQDTMGSMISVPPLYERALAITAKIFGANSLATANILDRLARFYIGYDQEKPSNYYRQALAMREQILGPKHPEVAATLDALARVNNDLTSARRALAIREEVLGHEHQDTATSLITVADILMHNSFTIGQMYIMNPKRLYWAMEPGIDKEDLTNKNDCLIAEPLYKRALAIRESALNIDTYRTSQSHAVVILAYCYNHLNQFDNAERLLAHDLAQKIQILGAAHEATVISMEWLADFYATQSQDAKAEQLLQRAVEVRTHALGANDATVASLETLADFYNSHAQYAKEEVVLQQIATTTEQIPGIDTHKIIYKIDNLVTFYRARGQYAQEEHSLQREVTMGEKAWGPGYEYAPQHANSGDQELAKLAAFYTQHKQDTQQEQLWQRSLTAIEHTWGATHDYTMQAAIKLANFYLQREQYAKAEPLIQRVLTNIDTANSTLNPSATDFFTELHITKNWEQCEKQIRIILNFATIYQRHAQYEKMDQLVRRAINIAEIFKFVTKNSNPLIKSAIDYVWLEASSFYVSPPYILDTSVRQYTMRDKFYAYVVTTRTQTLGPQHPLTIQMMRKLAESYIEHDFNTETRQQAQFLHNQARQLYTTILNSQGDKQEYDDIIQLAKTYEKLGLYAEPEHAPDFYAQARKLYEQVLTISEVPDYERVTVPLANIYVQSNQYAQAEQLLTKWLATYTKVHNQADVADKIGKIADFYYAHGHYTQAWPMYQRYVIASDYAPWDRKEIAKRYIAHNQYQLLAELYAGLVAHNYDNEDFRMLARAYQKLGKTLQALETARQATFYIRKYPTSTDAADTLIPIRKHLWLHLDLLGNLQFTDDNRTDLHLDKQFYAAEAFEIGQLYHNHSVGSALTQMAARFATGNTSLTKLIRNREALLQNSAIFSTQLATAQAATCGNFCGLPSFVYTPSTEEVQLRAHLSDLRKQKILLDRQLQHELPTYEELASPSPITASKIQQLLAADEAMLVFVFGDASTNHSNVDQTSDNAQDNDHGYVWLLMNSQLQMRRLPFGKAKLQERVAVLRQSLSPDANPDMATAYPVAAAYDLYKNLMGPEEEWLSDVRTLFIVADGALEQLPFSVLVTAPPTANPQDYQQVAWLARKWATVTLPTVSSLRALREIATVSTANKPFIGFGDPNFSGATGSQRGISDIMLTRSVNGELADPQQLRDILPPLPETADELTTIAKILGAGADTTFLRDQASVPTVMASQLSEYKVVYFATHALVAGQMKDFELGGVEPAIALTPPDVATSENDGLLRASRVAQLKLNADWVVLSACNTAAADGTSSGVGMSGLAKAFFYAGARALLVSHWSVLSKPAVALTTTMFQEWQLNPGIGRAEALRRAQMAVLEHPLNPLYTHPQAWAPFVVAGEGGVGR